MKNNIVIFMWFISFLFLDKTVQFSKINVSNVKYINVFTLTFILKF